MICYPWASVWVCARLTLTWYGGSCDTGCSLPCVSGLSAKAFLSLFSSHDLPVRKPHPLNHLLGITMMFSSFSSGSLDSTSFFTDAVKPEAKTCHLIPALGSLVSSLGPCEMESIFSRPWVKWEYQCQFTSLPFGIGSGRSMFARKHTERQSISALVLRWIFPQSFLNCFHVASVPCWIQDFCQKSWNHCG